MLNNHFPLFFTNNIFENIGCYVMYSFADGNLEYNHIHVVQSDWFKMAFITLQGIFIYVVIPFGLCNASATFQRAMTFIFSDLLHKSMTVFIDGFCVRYMPLIPLSHYKPTYVSAFLLPISTYLKLSSVIILWLGPLSEGLRYQLAHHRIIQVLRLDAIVDGHYNRLGC